MEAISDDAGSLDAASKALYAAITRRAEATNAYQGAMEAALIEIRDEFAAKGERLPAEDLRTALAHQRIERKVYADYLTAQAQVEAMKARTRAISDAMSGRQSLLAALRDELKAAP